VPLPAPEASCHSVSEPSGSVFAFTPEAGGSLPPAPPGTVWLPVRPSGFTLVDADVAAAVAGKANLYLYQGYVGLYWRGHSGHWQFLHRFVVGVSGGTIHHRNGQPRDNRRCNLEVLGRVEHCLLHARPGRSGWIGVVPYNAGFRLRMRVGLPGGCHLVELHCAYLAARARDEYINRLLGPRGPRNFPRVIPARRLRRTLTTRRDPFRVVFVRRRDRLLREIWCRLPLPLELATCPPRVNAVACHLLSVIDLECQEYRFIPLEGVLCVQLNGTWCWVQRERPASTASATSSVPPVAGRS